MCSIATTTAAAVVAACTTPYKNRTKNEIEFFCVRSESDSGNTLTLYDSLSYTAITFIFIA